MRQILAILAVVTLLLPVTSSAQHSGYWKAATPKGKAYKCQLVETQQQMEQTLTEAGWPVEKGMPVIDWSKDCAIIVAPDKYYKDGEIAFYGLAWENGRYLLKFGWTSLEVAEVGPSSATFGSGAEGTAETIAVSFPHYMHASNTLLCSNLGRQ